MHNFKCFPRPSVTLKYVTGRVTQTVDAYSPNKICFVDFVYLTVDGLFVQSRV